MCRRRKHFHRRLWSITTRSLYHRRTWGQSSRSTPSTSRSRLLCWDQVHTVTHLCHCDELEIYLWTTSRSVSCSVQTATNIYYIHWSCVLWCVISVGTREMCCLKCQFFYPSKITNLVQISNLHPDIQLLKVTFLQTDKFVLIYKVCIKI